MDNVFTFRDNVCTFRDNVCTFRDNVCTFRDNVCTFREKNTSFLQVFHLSQSELKGVKHYNHVTKRLYFSSHIILSQFDQTQVEMIYITVELFVDVF